MYYALIGLCVVFSGVRLFFNKSYINCYGAGVRSSLWNTGLSCGIFFLLMLPLNALMYGNWLNPSLFSILLALLFALLNVTCSAVAFKTMEIGNLSTYTLVLMMGGMVLPFLYGMFLGGDAHTWQKWVCLAIITVAMVVNMSKTENRSTGKRGFLALLYTLLFVENGAACIVLAVHGEPQYTDMAVDSVSFTLWYMLFTSLLCFAVCLFLRWKDGAPNPPVKRGLDIAYSVGNGVFYGAANLISLICLSHVDPSAQFPILTGGSIVMAGVVGRLFFREKITLRFVIATVLVIAATLLLLPWGEFIGA